MDDDIDPGRAEQAPGGNGTADAAGEDLGDPGALPARPVAGDQVRIAAVEAAVAAGLAPSTGRWAAPGPADPADDGALVSTGGFTLPDWSDPPTGQVPRIVLGEQTAEGEDPYSSEPVLRGPIWREESADWDDQVDLSFLAEQDPLVLDELDAAPARVGDPFDLDLDLDRPTATERPTGHDGAEGVDDAWAPLLERSGAPSAGASARRGHTRSKAAGSGAAPAKRSPLVATFTGLGAGAVAIAAFLGGAVSAVALVALVATLAAGEAFGSLRRAGYAPATLLGLIAVPALVLGAYARGLQALPAVLALFVVAGALWFLLKVSDAPPVRNLAVTVLVVAWIGVLGSFAGLILDPARYPHRHGIAYLVAAIALTVAHDVGSYAVGARLGRHRLAATVSPNKSVEGLIGGTVLTVVVAVLVVARIHPLHLSDALVLGVLVACVAPLGDLTESLVKRDLGVKDMGRLLPAHGGVLDRIDAMLFVLPVTYYALHALGLG